MTAINYKLLKPISSKEIQLWDYLTYFKEIDDTSFNFPVVSLSSVIKQRKQFITIDDSQTYKRCRVQLYAKGVELRDEVLGSAIKTKRQQLCKKDDFLVAEIDAKNGGYGIIPSHLEEAVVSSHYFLYEINQEKLLPKYLELYIKTDVFASQVKAVGSTNYAAIRPYHVLEYTIPLPNDLDTQRYLVNEYNQKLTQAQEAESQADELEKGIESYFLQELGIEKSKPVEKKQGLQVMRFKELSRWDYGYAIGEEQNIFTLLERSKYPTMKLGEVYNFINRPWSSKRHQNSTFRYIEIGSVDSFSGITNYTEIETKKAPSRATQIIKENDLIIGLTRPNLKKFTLVSKEYDDYICSSAFQIISPSDNYNLEFLLEFLKSDAGVKQVSFFMAGALYPAITSTQLKNLQIPLPPSDIQTQIVNHIAAEKEKIKTLRQQAEALRKQAKEEFENEIFA